MHSADSPAPLYQRTREVPTSLALFPELETPASAIRHSAGLLPSQRIRDLIDAGYITATSPIEAAQIQPASLDLRLGPVAYRVRASFLPGAGARSTVLSRVEELKTHEVDLSRPSVLEKGCVYVAPLMEEWYLPSSIYGRANPKSTTGRLDVFTRLITDYGTEFDGVPAGYKGKLYLEIVPRTFSILVREGTRLNQIRFLRGDAQPADSALVQLHQAQPILFYESGIIQNPTIDDGVWISVDVAGMDESEIVGYRAKAYAPLIDLDRVDYYDLAEFWEPIHRTGKRHLILNPGDFYILASKERVRVPPEFAAEMVAYDPSVGEFRIHYAGFFDPGFGFGTGGAEGTHAVLEVRSHEVPFVLEDWQRVGRLVFERLLDVPDKLYGPAIGSTYQGQDLALSKQFKRS